MKKNKRAWSLLLLLFIVTNRTIAQSDSLQNLAFSLVQKERIDTTPDFYASFSKFGKEIIPYLIDVIDKNETGFLGFQDLSSSKIHFVHNNYVGIRAAYVIEHILSNSKKERIFNYCVIVRIVNGEPEMKSLNLEDMKSLKKIYYDWWTKNRHKSLQNLLKDWNSNKRPLDNSIYAWK
ncbi:MAG: hypothetical protein ACO1NW_03800 [Chitinophagaceae bacterium]